VAASQRWRASCPVTFLVRQCGQYRRLFEPDLRPDDRTKKLGDELIEITEIGGVPTPYCIGIVDAKKTENLVFHLQSPRQFRFRAKTSPVFADTGATCEALIDRPARPPHLLNRPYLIGKRALEGRYRKIGDQFDRAGDVDGLVLTSKSEIDPAGPESLQHETQRSTVHCRGLVEAKEHVRRTIEHARRRGTPLLIQQGDFQILNQN
jgi:hypothetical protein